MSSSCKKQNPILTLYTELGNVQVELYADKAPISSRNFLRYVKEDRLKGIMFYRTVTTQPDNQPDKDTKIDVVQGGFGIHYQDPTTNPYLLPPIEHETTNKTGLTHEDGTISMARDAPGTAQAEFFICIGAQPELDFGGKRNSDGTGFAAFGKVVSGMDIVRQIHRYPNEAQIIQTPVEIRSVKVNE